MGRPCRTRASDHDHHQAVSTKVSADRRRIVAEVDRRLSIARGVEAEVDAKLKRAQALQQAVPARALRAGLSGKQVSSSASCAA
jgi:hypothetical protein